MHTTCGKTLSKKLSEFIQSAKGCFHCYGKHAKSLEEVQTEILKIDKNYNVLDVWTKNGHSYMKCKHISDICNNHEFNMRASDFVSVHAQRCPKCMDMLKDSKAVRNIESFLNEKNIAFQREVKIGAKNITDLPYDFYIPSLNLLIEYDGIQHFKAVGFIPQKKVDIQKVRDQIKTNFASENWYNLLRINYKQNEINVLSKTIQKLTTKDTLS